MKKPNINEAFKSLKRSTSKYSPQILTGLGITGVVTTTVLAVKATPKAIRLIEKEQEIKNDILTPIEVVKATWKCYIPTAISMTTSIMCLIGATSVNAKRNAALAAAYKLSETALIEYKDKVVETIGEKKEKVVREKVADDRIKSNPPQQNNIIISDKGTTLFLEPVSGRYFQSDMQTIMTIINNLNKKMLHDINGFMSLNDFYDEIGLEHTSIGYELGWNAYNLIDVDPIARITPDDKACIYLDYVVSPKYDYMKF